MFLKLQSCRNPEAPDVEQERVSSFKACSLLENLGTQSERLEVAIQRLGVWTVNTVNLFEDSHASGNKMTVRCIRSESHEAYETQSNSNCLFFRITKMACGEWV